MSLATKGNSGEHSFPVPDALDEKGCVALRQQVPLSRQDLVRPERSAKGCRAPRTAPLRVLLFNTPCVVILDAGMPPRLDKQLRTCSY